MEAESSEHHVQESQGRREQAGLRRGIPWSGAIQKLKCRFRHKSSHGLLEP